MDSSVIPKINSKLIYRDKDGVLFDTENGKLIEFNGSGNKIVQLCSKNLSVKDIIQALSIEYKEEKVENIEQMVNEFLEAARKAKIIEF